MLVLGREFRVRPRNYVSMYLLHVSFYVSITTSYYAPDVGPIVPWRPSPSRYVGRPSVTASSTRRFLRILNWSVPSNPSTIYDAESPNSSPMHPPPNPLLQLLLSSHPGTFRDLTLKIGLLVSFGDFL